jgi:c-di-GMP-binding flagellar brake protein YcgR
MSSAQTQKGNKERRSARRFQVSLPVVVHPVPSQQDEALSGRTRDISARGLYFTVDRELNPGSELDLTLTLPAELTHGTELLVRARCKVVRAENRREESIERMGVAAIIQRYDIVRAEPRSILTLQH